MHCIEAVGTNKWKENPAAAASKSESMPPKLSDDSTFYKSYQPQDTTA